jgi:hypothetical protein
MNGYYIKWILHKLEMPEFSIQTRLSLSHSIPEKRPLEPTSNFIYLQYTLLYTDSVEVEGFKQCGGPEGAIKIPRFAALFGH